MRWSLRLGRVNGVPVEAHWLSILLAAWASYAGWSRGGLGGLAGSLGLLTAVFGSILIHEIAHTLQAQAAGLPVRRILLLPIGGLAQLGQLPERPSHELRVAAAGPGANLGLALVFGGLAGAWLGAGGLGLRPLDSARLVLLRGEPAGVHALLYLGLVNASLALFNLAPAFPFDGARVLRGGLALVMPRYQATRLVGGLGWMVGLVSILLGAVLARRWGLAVSASLVFVGLTAVLGASAEEMLERHFAALQRIPAWAAVRQPTLTLAPTDRLTGSLAAALQALDQPLLPVVEQSRLVGVVTRRELAAASRQGEAPAVGQLMRTTFAHVAAEADLWHAQQALAVTGAEAIPVVDGGRLHGVLTSADIRAAALRPPSMHRVETPQLISAGEASL